MQLLEQSVQLLAKHQQFLAAAALASLILEAFNTAGVRVSDDSIGMRGSQEIIVTGNRPLGTRCESISFQCNRTDSGILE